MNRAGVTCLTVVVPSGHLTSHPPYLADTIFQVPTNFC